MMAPTERIQKLREKMEQLLVGYPTVDLRARLDMFCTRLPFEKMLRFIQQLRVRVILVDGDRSTDAAADQRVR